jgi:hypothetical protein
MKQIEFTKANNEIPDVKALHAWLDKSIKWIKNGRHELVLREKRKKRSVAQNRLMWLWFTCIEVEVGQPKQDIHDYYCMKYLRNEIANPATGEVIAVPGHTSELTTQAFTRFLNQVQSDAAAELGITLPSPDDEAYADFEDTYKPYLQ